MPQYKILYFRMIVNVIVSEKFVNDSESSITNHNGNHDDSVLFSKWYEDTIWKVLPEGKDK